MYRDQIQTAYLKATAQLSIPSVIVFKPVEGGNVETEAKINWVPERIKDDVSRIVDENQGILPLDGAFNEGR